MNQNQYETELFGQKDGKKSGKKNHCLTYYTNHES